jgi:putative ABC transport system substrate-binding protein
MQARVRLLGVRFADVPRCFASVLRRWLRPLLLSLLATAALAGAARAAPSDVIIVLSKPQGAHAETGDALRQALQAPNASKTAVETVSIDDGDWSDKVRQTCAKPGSVVVSVGTQAAEKITARHPSCPVLHTLIPRLAYVEIVRPAAGTQQVSAVYIDQPLARQLELIRLALPEHDRISVLLGPSSADQRGELRAITRSFGFELALEQITAPAELLPALNRTLADSDVLLSVADPMIFNGSTIHHLLLTTYRERVPVIGLSRAYVDAGALTAVYSTPEQIGKQAGEILLAWPGGRAPLPPPQYPRYYKVAVNQRVAASLGLHVESESTLLRELQAGKGRP